LAPTDSMRWMTAWISSGVAVGFMTIIILGWPFYAWEGRVRVLLRRSVSRW
jgi:hypothetical protein